VFVRFVAVESLREDPWCADGVITASSILLRERRIRGPSAIKLRAIYAWFNANVTCPPFTRKLWTKDAVCWFKEGSYEAIRKTQSVIHILRKHGVIVRTMRYNYPGKIVYRDKFQVVAETPKNKIRTNK
jgi:hypothetical protein